MTVNSDYRPPIWLRSGMLQTALASNSMRKKRGEEFESNTTKLVLNAGPGLRTSCYLNERPDAAGMIILFHGWLGTPQSSYVVSAAKALHDAGFSVARLTLPEHGEAALMNAAVIDLSRHDFIREAVWDIASRSPETPLGLMGFSLGGNFALRLARDLKAHPIPQLRHVLAVSPVIEPSDTCDMIDAFGIFRRYFLKKFADLSREKQAEFPEMQGVQEVLAKKSIRSLTEFSVRQWTEYPSIEAYFNAYRIHPDDFAGCPTSLTLLTALDDPIVRSIHAQRLSESAALEPIFTRHGGHNGFFSRFPSQAFSDDVAVKKFRQSVLG
ncbi:alpha/beta fold hydrolase [Primorskyibacter sp. S87]|uniref:alpha/beta fold hydrolase n=1 Tax=Primorskyibacter sp. S87 TaxID=3415126 RepID=UPI003C7D76D6